MTQIYFIRHAEKERDNSEDPLLTKEGESRANQWATVFKNIDFAAVYSTQTIRTVSTALPTAAQKEKEIIVYDYETIDIIAIAKKYPGQSILIVGHSNSTPMLVNNLLGEDLFPEIDDDNFSNLYIVTYTEGLSSATLLYIE
jgi:broad specificity phosphatase PhoE